jgi:hypothetical protein
VRCGWLIVSLQVLEEQFANLADGPTFPERVLDSVSGAKHLGVSLVDSR